MSTYPPFIVPLKTPSCPAAWRGGKRGPPSFCRYEGAWITRSGVHALLRAAGLPRAELLHMGATRELLANSGAPLDAAKAAPLLGRIVADSAAHYGHETPGTCAEIGAAVIEEWFS